MLGIDISPAAGRAIKKATRQEQVAIVERITELREDPLAGTVKLVNYDVRRAIVRKPGVEARILYVHDDEKIEVLTVGQRNDDEVYKWLRQNYRTSKPGTNEHGY